MHPTQVKPRLMRASLRMRSAACRIDSAFRLLPTRKLTNSLCCAASLMIETTDEPPRKLPAYGKAQGPLNRPGTPTKRMSCRALRPPLSSFLARHGRFDRCGASATRSPKKSRLLLAPLFTQPGLACRAASRSQQHLIAVASEPALRLHTWRLMQRLAPVTQGKRHDQHPRCAHTLRLQCAVRHAPAAQ